MDFLPLTINTCKLRVIQSFVFCISQYFGLTKRFRLERVSCNILFERANHEQSEYLLYHKYYLMNRPPNNSSSTSSKHHHKLSRCLRQGLFSCTRAFESCFASINSGFSKNVREAVWSEEHCFSHAKDRTNFVTFLSAVCPHAWDDEGGRRDMT